MKYKMPELEEFSKETAHNGDIYLYQDGKLLYIGNTIPEPTKPSLWQRFFIVRRVIEQLKK